MANKKGDGDVDWVISIGIFLIYLLGMFVIIKPGIEPVHNYNTLLDILEEKGKQDANVEHLFDLPNLKFGGLYWTLYKVPLFFNVKPNSPCIKINFPYTLVDNNKINVYSINVDELTKKITLTTLGRELSGGKLSIEEKSGNWDSPKEYIIFFSNSIIYDKDSATGYESLFEDNNILNVDACVEEGGDDPFKYNLGVSETTRGISVKAIEILKTYSEGTSSKQEFYEKLKEIYGYPKSKEFSLTITKQDMSKIEYSPVIPDVKTNVYTREWGDFILNYDGTRNPVKVNIKVW